MFNIRQFVGTGVFFRQIAVVTAIGMAISTLLRICFLFMAPAGSLPGPFGTAAAFLTGLIFDLSTAVYWLMPLFILYIVLPSNSLKRSKYLKWFLGFSSFVLFIWTFAAIAEIVFWQEFNSRFNFIAVDYLVYTHEVIRNIWESYPIIWLVLGVMILSALMAYVVRRAVTVTEIGWSPARSKMMVAFVGILLFAGNYFLISENLLPPSTKHVQRELTKNGLAALFAAYFHNEIDYDLFYSRIPNDEAFGRVKKLLTDQDDLKIQSGLTIARKVTPPTDEVLHARAPLNVIMVVMESMSARFMGAYDPSSKLTPFLDRFAHEGLFFRHVYATGTRTVRGLEAVTLSVPPTPGQSIVRRPGNENLYSIGSILSEHGYKKAFVYGGDAFFDNMKAFYSANGFSVFDEPSMKHEEISFSNAWGVCDEDLFNMAIREADLAQKEHKPFLQVVMTTSNHRPYTFPEGKIDLPTSSGRSGAVKYSDYAVGQLIKNSENKPWFKNTLFVFIADHNASVGGGVDVPIGDYLIPAIVYNPLLIKPQVVETLGSQIDIVPTLLALMGVSYESHFYGHDLLTTKDERAFISNYQKVGLLRKGKLVLLSPPRKVDRYSYEEDSQTHLQVKQAPLPDTGWDKDEDVKDAIAYYESASYLFKNELMKLKSDSAAAKQVSAIPVCGVESAGQACTTAEKSEKR
jgi:phosphoglycerol transferase MdoB-like AlkP superfamily enzyme